MLSAQSVWSVNGQTFVNRSTLGNWVWGIFVDINNTLYTLNRDTKEIHVWLNGNTSPSRILQHNYVEQTRLFVSMDGTLYTDAGDGANSWGVVQRWDVDSTVSTIIMHNEGRCHGLFVDLNGNIYCSMRSRNLVRKQSFNDPINVTSMVAGNGVAGSDGLRLNYPLGIFVTANFTLYVADCGNDRVQMFLHGNLSGVTVLGNGSSQSMSIKCPTAIAFDRHGYMFVTSFHQVIGSGPNGFRCVAACGVSVGSNLNQLHEPKGISFDSDGNLFVADWGNARIQKFVLVKNISGKVAVVSGRCELIACVS
jgi:hypothetical protein